MKYCRFAIGGHARYGIVESSANGEQITQVMPTAPEHGGAEQLESGEAMKPLALANAPLLCPVQPTKIICVGRNYRAHAAELGNELPKEPLLFFKPPSALQDPGKEIRRPAVTERVDFEGELGVVIGKRCYKLPAGADVRPYISGYTVVNDVTARDLQKKDGQWTRAKGFDTFCPVGPMVSSEIDPWQGVAIETRVNGEVRQRGNTRDFVFSLDVLIHYIADVFTLMPGDLICTGTPGGVGPMVAGDVVEVTVEGIGTLKNSVVNE
jgi:2-keto-4-pentenoate hydratase/2-oxohepta-3-ene-1,7-dioic acid hydratase in catechol pathway